MIVWRFHDDRPGHGHQSQGLVQALTECVDVTSFDIAAADNRGMLSSWLLGRYEPGHSLPDPDILLGAGHRTHGHLLAACRCRGGKAIVLMKPSLPLSWFDLCVIPEHDHPPERGNIYTTKGALNQMFDAGRHDEKSALLVLGGPSRHYQWNDQVVLAQVEELLKARADKNWVVTTSRRTPVSMSRYFSQIKSITFIPFNACEKGWFAACLQQVGEVWVSEDSVSMVYEALTAGTRVGLLRVATSSNQNGENGMSQRFFKKNAVNRLANAIDQLVEKKWVGRPGDWQLPAGPKIPINEATRCARWITEVWLKKN